MAQVGSEVGSNQWINDSKVLGSSLTQTTFFFVEHILSPPNVVINVGLWLRLRIVFSAYRNWVVFCIVHCMMQSAMMAFINVQCILDCILVSVSTEPVYSDDQFAHSYSNPYKLNINVTIVCRAIRCCPLHSSDILPQSQLKALVEHPLTLACVKQCGSGGMCEHRIIQELNSELGIASAIFSAELALCSAIYYIITTASSS